MTALARAPSGLRLRKYAHYAWVSAQQVLSERAVLLGRMAFYLVLLLVFSRLWTVVAERGALAHLSASGMLWYLALTEWVVLSMPTLHLEVEEDVRTGQIAYRLARPVSYLGTRLAEAAGDAALRAVLLGSFGLVFACLLAGGLPEDPRGLALALPLGLLAIAQGMIFLAVIGLLAFWLQDCSPVYWLWQKATFVLGGLLLPLDVYPAWLVEVAWYTPFPALIYGPASMAFRLDPAGALDVLTHLAVWTAIAAGLAAWLYRRARITLDVNGG